MEYAGDSDEESENGNKNYYICPRYWNVIEERSVSQKEIDDNHLQKNIVTKEESYDPENKSKFILDLTSPLEHFKTGSYNPYLPGFLKTLKTKSGQCLPCCFTGVKGKGNDGNDFKNYQLFKKEQEVIEKCKQNKKDVEISVSKGHAVPLNPLTKGSEVNPGSPKQPKKKKSKSNLYVSKADAAFPLQQNNLGFLPPSLQLFLFENENYSKECKSSKGDILVDDKLCVLRMGTVEEEKDAANVNKNQYFISCIANIYNSLTDQSLSSKDFKHRVLIPRLTFDNFIIYQNGTLVETFKKFEYVDREKLLTYKETDLFKKIFTDSEAVDDDEDNNLNSYGNLNKYPNVVMNNMLTAGKKRFKHISGSRIAPGSEHLYMLKSEIVPPVCPACPAVTTCPTEKKCPPCPPCARCPEPAFECKKVPNYSGQNDSYLPQPVMSDFSQFGL